MKPHHKYFEVQYSVHKTALVAVSDCACSLGMDGKEVAVEMVAERYPETFDVRIGDPVEIIDERAIELRRQIADEVID